MRECEEGTGQVRGLALLFACVVCTQTTSGPEYRLWVHRRMDAGIQYLTPGGVFGDNTDHTWKKLKLKL